MEKKQRFNPTFENGGFWEYYKDLERQLENYLYHIPYLLGNENTYSFRLANLILAIGAHIDSAFKEIAKYSVLFGKYPEMLSPKTKDGKLRKPTIRDYYPISEAYGLTEESVMFRCLPDREQLCPFHQYQRNGRKCPDWWTAYNNVKHNFNENFKDATLKTIRDALAGAFLLNVIHVPASVRLFGYGLLKPKYNPPGFEQIYDTFRGLPMYPERPLDVKIEDPFIIETPLFLYDYEKIMRKKEN
jgi:hypothetical protein